MCIFLQRIENAHLPAFFQMRSTGAEWVLQLIAAGFYYQQQRLEKKAVAVIAASTVGIRLARLVLHLAVREPRRRGEPQNDAAAWLHRQVCQTRHRLFAQPPQYRVLGNCVWSDPATSHSSVLAGNLLTATARIFNAGDRQYTALQLAPLLPFRFRNKMLGADE